MATLWDLMKASLVTVDRAAEPHSVLSGQETDKELRELVLQLTQRCPVGELNRHCPFYTLNGLSYETVKNIVEQMSRNSLLEMFDEEDIKATWFIPGHTLETFPEQCAMIRDGGHEM